MPKVINRKNVVIPITLNGTSSEYFSTFDTTFVPNEMIVKYISHYSHGFAGITYVDSFLPVNVDFTHVGDQAWPIPQYTDTLESYSLVRCDIVNEYIGTIIDNAAINKFDTVFTINKPISGAHKFSLHNINGTARTNRTGALVIHLEFVQYGK